LNLETHLSGAFAAPRLTDRSVYNKPPTMKAAIVILSDPNADNDDALGRLFNGLSTAYEFQSQGDAVSVLFSGPGTRWPAVLADATHPAHELYKSLEGSIAGVSCGCADVFGATEAAEAAGMPLIKDFALPGTSGVPSLRSLIQDGHQVLTF